MEYIRFHATSCQHNILCVDTNRKTLSLNVLFGHSTEHEYPRLWRRDNCGNDLAISGSPWCFYQPHGCKSLLFLNSNALKATGSYEYHNRFKEGERQQVSQCMNWHWFCNFSFINRSLNMPVKVAAVSMMPSNNFRSWITESLWDGKTHYQALSLPALGAAGFFKLKVLKPTFSQKTHLVIWKMGFDFLFHDIL